MTNDDLSRIICDKLEPIDRLLNPAFTSIDRLIKAKYTRPEPQDRSWWVSPLGLHQFINGLGWRHVDMVDDGNKTVFLIERMIRLNCSHMVFQTWPDGVRLDLHNLSRQPVATGAESVGRAVAEGLAKMMDWL